MNTSKNIVKVLASAIVLIGQLAIISPASAGIFNWVLNDPQTEIVAESNQSFESIYSSLKSFNVVQPQQAVSLQGGIVISQINPATVKAVPENRKVISYTVTATAYSSTPDQTDSSPFITASGTHVRDGVVAANFLPLGTVIKIPDLYGDKTFVVEDRMNRRYWNRVDIWFNDRSSALKFGKKTIKIEIVS